MYKGGSLVKLKERKLISLLKSVIYLINHLDFYDNVGSNGIFGANPSVVKFAGFEIRKTHTLKVRLINNSPAP